MQARETDVLLERHPEKDVSILVEHLQKRYRLGAINSGTLKGDIQEWWAKVRGRESPHETIDLESRVEFGGKYFRALNDVSFEVNKGDTLGILGANGAGKTTLLKVLSRITVPSGGTICIDGQIASMLGAGTGFHPDLTGRENVYLNGSILGMRKSEIRDKMDNIIAFSECERFIDTPVKRYSSGMYVRLAFAVAAHLDSDILLMDEVLATGDTAFQEKCLQKMWELAQQEHRTVLYVSHQEATVRALCNRCIVLHHGRLVYNGTVDDAYHFYKNLS